MYCQLAVPEKVLRWLTRSLFFCNLDLRFEEAAEHFAEVGCRDDTIQEKKRASDGGT